ncbi:putative DNA ligase [Emiliania huxleyi CCMP1516]|uniref:ATP-dependent DNA ligase family profile domain-containing protein n=2 Tax=Emiliania huxleyi TaxID=2903 RepID=A0A0D3IHI0_EMIH1|nr:putative DNA ligase [Emiliania huxleyi CCMP1516]EOD10715.1 putative DNA ligase [Emiliania huxleyi CCMP1516]|eukprot:XP_005763144.1 putative DNA ligase [Emiliania huxleyi CCMP1516]
MPDTEASEEDKVAAIAAAPVPVPDAEVGEEAEAAAGPENVSDDASYVSLRAMLGERPSEALLRTLLAEAGGDVSTAANTFFDAGEHGRIPSAKRQCTLSAFFGGRRESATSSAAAVAPAPPLASPERKRGSAPIDLTGASPSSLPMAAAPSPARDLTPAVAAPATHGPSALPPPPSEAEPPPTCRTELTEALHLYSPGAAGWPSAAPVPYSHIAAALDAVSATRSRLTKELVLTNFFRACLALDASPGCLEACCYLLSPAKDAQSGGHRLRPDWSTDARPLGLSHGAITSAILEATNAPRAEYSAAYAKLRDSGDAALAVRDGHAGSGRQTFLKRPARGILEKLRGLATLGGAGVEKAKATRLSHMLRAAAGSEIKWLDAIRGAYSLRPDVSVLVEALRLADAPRAPEPLAAFRGALSAACSLAPGVPSQPMLASLDAELGPGVYWQALGRQLARPCSSIADALKLLRGPGGGPAAFAAEHKYDGQRAQLHRAPCGSAGAPGAPALGTFQSLSTRKRKGVTTGNAAAASVPVCLFLFDLLLLGDESLLARPLRARRDALRAEFAPIESAVSFAASRLDAAYEPSWGTRRSDGWVKCKKDYIDGMGDSLDLVPIGGWRGQGRKKRWVSPWLMATYDAASGTYGSVCRVMSGFSDAFYRENTIKPADVETGERAQYWFTPCEVWEVRGADFTISPVHMAAAGLVHPTRGLSMRFPRFVRKRPDKRLSDATTPEQLAGLYRKQTQGQAED